MRIDSRYEDEDKAMLESIPAPLHPALQWVDTEPPLVRSLRTAKSHLMAVDGWSLSDVEAINEAIKVVQEFHNS